MAAAALARGLLTEYLRQTPVWVLDERDARQALARLALRQVEVRDGTEHYLFPGLRQEKMIKQCPYCGNEYPLSQAGRTCPSCGGNLEVKPG